MTPKLKAQELIKKFVPLVWAGTSEHSTAQMDNARSCALICVDEILSLRMIHNMGRGKINDMNEGAYWQQVKESIQSM